MFRMLLTGALVAMAAGCSPQTARDRADSGAPCADASTRLPVTGLCAAEAAAAIPAERRAGGPALEGPAAGCTWTYQEVAIGDGSEAVLYRALNCGGVVTAFEYSGGAHSASLSYRASALGYPAGREAARIFVSDPANPTQVIKTLADDLPAAERARCEVQPANIDGWPRDALVIGYNAQAARTLPAKEPNAVCGDFGLNEDEMKYWLVRDGYAYFFSLGQDGLDFDPNSFTLLKKGDDGRWARAS